MILARVFVYKETTEMYQLVFERLARIIDELTGRSLKWQHIHREGLTAVVMDMSTKQASGKN